MTPGMDSCPQNPEGHLWQFLKEWTEDERICHLERSGPFKKWREKKFGPILRENLDFMESIHRCVGWKNRVTVRKWACSKCRKVANTYTDLEDAYREGHPIEGHRYG